MVKKSGILLLLSLITLSLCLGCSKTNEPTETVKADSSTEPIIESAPDGAGVPESVDLTELPLEVTFETKEYKQYESVTDLYFYFKIKNISGNNLISPLVGADLLDADGNIVYSEGFNHMGVLTPGQEFDGMLGIDSNNSYWGERDNITSLNLVYYMDNSHDLYTLETPVNVPIT